MKSPRDRLRATRAPTVMELAWAAGFLEGEGAFAVNGRKCEVVNAVQVNREPLTLLRDVFGGALAQRVPRGQQKPYWHWQTSGARARGIMLTIYPWLSARRRGQVTRALAARGPLTQPEYAQP